MEVEADDGVCVFEGGHGAKSVVLMEEGKKE